MGRTFLVLALANMCLAEPALEEEYLPVMDKIIGETIRLEQTYGFYHFLLDYGRARPFVVQPARSLFVDGEIAVMLGARQMVEQREEYGPMLRERVDGMIEQMQRGPVLSGECYPNECWTFCNSFALAAITLSDCLDGRDHSDFCRRWIASLNFGGFPRQREGKLEYCAGNQVGEAVVLYALTLGPLWEKVKTLKKAPYGI